MSKGIKTLPFWILSLVILGKSLSQGTASQGDTRALVDFSLQLLDCFQQRQWGECRAGGFPLLQHIPVIMMKAIGLTEGLDHLLAYLNHFAFFGIGRLTWKTLHRKAGKAVALTGLFILITSPFLYYYRSSFGETLSAYFILWFVYCLLKQAGFWQTALAFFLAGMTKETAAPLLLVITVGCLGPVWFSKGYSQIRRTTAGIGSGLLLHILQTGLFNWFRFASFQNSWYLSENSFVKTLSDQVSFFAGLWWSPNGGLIFFWVSFVFLLAVSSVLYLRTFSRTLPSFIKGAAGKEAATSLFFVCWPCAC